MTYAEDREYSPLQKALVIYFELRQHGQITTRRAAEVAGCGERRALDILKSISGVVCVGSDERGLWYCPEE